MILNFTERDARPFYTTPMCRIFIVSMNKKSPVQAQQAYVFGVAYKVWRNEPIMRTITNNVTREITSPLYNCGYDQNGFCF